MSGRSEVVASAADRAAWLKAREALITASDVATILGANPWCSPLMLYARKKGIVPPQDETQAMRMGLRLEPVLMDLYREETGRPVRSAQTLLRSTEYPWIGATCDAYTTIRTESDPLELKTTGAHKAGDWEDGVPDHYVPQVQTQMLVTGAEVAAVAVLIGGRDFKTYEMEASPGMFEAILDATQEFLARLRENRPPPPSGDDSSMEAILALFPHERTGTRIELPEAAVALDARIEALGTTVGALEDERKRLKQELAAMIGDAEEATLPSGVRWTWRTTERKEYTVAAQARRELRRSAAKRSKGTAK